MLKNTKKTMKRFIVEKGLFSGRSIEYKRWDELSEIIESKGYSKEYEEYRLATEDNEDFSKLTDFTIGNLLRAAEKKIKEKGIQTIPCIEFYNGIFNYRLLSSKAAIRADYLSTYYGLFLYHAYKVSEENITGKQIKTLSDKTSEKWPYEITGHREEIPDDVKDIICDSDHIRYLTLSVDEAITDYIKAVPNGIENLNWMIDFCKDISNIGKNNYLENRQTFSNFEIKYAASESLVSLENRYKDVIYDISCVLSACMRISLGLSNKNSGETLIKTVEYLEHKPKDKYDPHNVSALSCSTTLKIRLESENDFDNPKTIESYSMSYILDYIRKHGCIITDCKPINEGASKILKITVNRFQSDLSLRFCDSDQDIDLCIQFVHDYYREFHPKVTWKNNDYSISKMAEKGLKGIINQDGELEGKQWRALGYFEEQGLVAFVDSKNRVDGNLELGIALTRRGYRGQFLVSSLIWYHILDNYASPVFTGTYETNKPMKDILERCGFHDHYLVDGNKQSPRVKERFSVDEIPSSGGEPTNVNELSHYYMRVSEQSIVFDKLVKECSENG